MEFKTTGIQWTNLELTGLLEDEDSCVYLERHSKHIGLHPFHLTNLNEALREILNVNLNFYDAELNGLLLAYKNPKILSPLGDIFYDTCYIHIDIEADFYIFRPEIGRNLKGFVNKKGTNHISILVHKAFNVSVPKPDDPDDEEDWPGDKVKVGQEVKFRTDKIDFKTGLPYIRGIIYEEEYLNGCKLFNEQIAATYESEFYKITRWNTSGKCTDNNKNVTPKQENKRTTFNFSDTEINLESDTDGKSVKRLKENSVRVQESIAISPKKKKRKSRTSESEPVDSSDTERKVNVNKNLSLNDSNDSDFKLPKHALKKSKTRKKNLIESNDSSDNEDIPSYTSKNVDTEIPNGRIKKRKSKIINSLNQSLTDNSADNEDSEFLVKKSKKRKKKLECNNTEDEANKSENSYASEQDISLNNEITIKKEFNTPKTPSKKRKRNSSENSTINNVDNEKNRSFNNTSEKFITENSESRVESIHTPAKKRKKKHDNEVNYDVTNETRHKKNGLTNLSDNLELDQFNNIESEVPKRKSKKYKHSMNNDSLNDTQNEKSYKSYLKSLVESVENDNIDNGSEIIEPKSKKHKKKNKSDIQFEFDPLSVKIKVEPQWEMEDKCSKKFKRIKNADIIDDDFYESENTVKEFPKKKHKKSHKKDDLVMNISKEKSDCEEKKKLIRTLLQNNLDSIIKVEKE